VFIYRYNLNVSRPVRELMSFEMLIDLDTF